MTNLLHEGIQNVSKIYGDLFTAFWKARRAQGSVKGRIENAEMTPPSLRRNMMPIHGENRNESILFKSRKFPTKSEVREVANRDIAYVNL